MKYSKIGTKEPDMSNTNVRF